MKNRFLKFWESTTLAAKIQITYMLILVPLATLLIFAFYSMFLSSLQYEGMINSVVEASEFSQDFKKDFDYETYLLIVENKSIQESELDSMLTNANKIVGRLRGLTDSRENMERLNRIQKYLDNLDTYKQRIEDNLKEGNLYDDNIEIWENDVQIVTSLIQETVAEYMYFEIRELQTSRNEYQQVFSGMLRSSIYVFVVIVILMLFLSWYLPRLLTRPIRELSYITDRVAKGDLSVRADMHTGVEVTSLSDSLNALIDKMNELIEQVKNEQVNLRKAEFEVLQAQINPHFLYNTLDAIVWLAEAGDRQMVISMVGNLSDFFRTSLNDGKTVISIREEIQHVKSYLNIQKVRYQDILKFEIDVPEEILRYRIPKITIQPLVENALYHGIKNTRGGGLIRIDGEIKDSKVIIRVKDNGCGMEADRLSKVRRSIRHKVPEEREIYGLYNVNERIVLNFGSEYGIDIDSEYMKGTRVKILLPLSDATSDIREVGMLGVNH